LAELVLLPFPPSATSPPDVQARAQALDIRSSFIVEAPAGSGKTGLLIQRYLKLLADESVTSPEQVLAITFTNKATAELRDRVLAQLELARLPSSVPAASEFEGETRALARAVLDRDRQLDWSLLDHPHRLHLRTIDSVCAEIARTLPILSGSGGRLTPATDAGPLHREAARRTLLLLGGDDAAFDAALRDLLLHRDGNLAECESLLADMLSLRDQWARLIPLAQHELEDEWLEANILPRLEQALDQAICKALAQLEDAFPVDLLAKLTELAASMAPAEGYKDELSPIAVCRGRQQPPASIAEHLEHWRALVHLLIKPSTPMDWRKSVARNVLRFEIEKHHAAQLKDLIERVSSTPALFDALCAVDQLPPAQYPAEQWAVAKSLFRVLARALVELQFVFAERGECDFTELSLLARHALAHDSSMDDLAAALGARLQHLLVDEMQDTSTSQYDLIERLTASWDGHSQTVFLVGDPHQSIYLFRQARVERFIQAMHTQRLGDLPLKRLRLTANFRSQHRLVEQFNHDFGLIFPDASGSLPYSPVQPTLPESPSSPGTVWHAHVLDAADSEEDRAPRAAEIRQRQAMQDADQIVRIARGWLAKPLPTGRVKPWSVAVLVRSRNHLNEVVSALRRQRDPIPFKAVEIEALNERQEILDLTALTRALLHPADRVAVLAVLRAPWCGLALADLYTLTGGDDSSLRHQSIPRLMAERGHLLPDQSCERMTRVWSVLHAASARRTSLATAQLVERAWLSLGGDAWLTSNQLANTRRFFQLLDEFDASGTRIDPGLLNARLRCLYAEPDPIPAGTGYIELLTIHKAKGLEWDVVLVPAMEKQVAGSRSRLLTWSEIDTSGSPHDGAAHIMLAPIAGKGEESQALNLWLNRLHRSREMAETKRLLYVACTRAREELHLFAAPQLSSTGELRPVFGSMLQAAWPAAEEHFAEAAANAAMPDDRWKRALEADEPIAVPVKSEALDLAAAAVASGPILQRLPSTFDPAARFGEALVHRLPYVESESEARPDSMLTTQFARPQGSVAARSFGNAVHACLDLLSSRVLNGATAAALLAELPQWTKRIAALLRSDGLPRPVVERLARDARATLEKALRDPTGLWLLAAHTRASSELAITSAGTESQSATGIHATTIRVDRVFEAGSEPLVPGQDCLWIIDYKTTAPGSADLDGFLAAQRATYGPQLEAYARVLAPARTKSPEHIRLALYFPAIPRLIWWQPLS
jgi:ATP-dependent helicase/nuclease subunit A